MIPKLLVISLLLIAAPLGAQYDFNGTYCYPESMKEDLDEIVSVIRSHHPDPYRYATKPEFDAHIDRIRRGFTEPLSVYDFMDRLMPLMDAIGDAHTYLQLPAELELQTMRNAPLIPVQVNVDGDRLFLMDELKGFRTIQPGSELISINGIPGEEILQKLRELVTTDGANTSYADHVITERFPLLFHRAFERSTQFEVRYKEPKAGAEQQAKLKALSAQQMASAGRSPVVSKKSFQWTSEVLEEGSILWLRIPTLSKEKIEQENIRPERILKECSKELEQPGMRTLVLDLRGCDGMEFQLAEAVYRLFSTGSFRILRNAVVRNPDKPVRLKLQSFPEEEMGLLRERMRKTSGAYELDPKDPVLALVQSIKRPFAGDVYIIQDGGTIEAAAGLSMMAHRDGRAKLVGKETGSNATSFCAEPAMTLVTRRTGVRLSVPLVKYEMERASNPVSVLGIKPDHQVHLRTNDPDHAQQAVEQDLLMFISEWR
jgi:hypothetical protein